MSAEISSRLERLLQHPALWRGRSAARIATLPTGFTALDEALPGGGWPRSGLIEVLIPRHGIGELHLWMPALARLTRVEPARWCALIAPPFEPFAPALAAQGVALERLLVVRPKQLPLWAMEQALLSGACEIALSWAAKASMRELRRLVLATEQGGTAGVLFRPASAAQRASPATLRIGLEGLARGVRLTFLKSRGGARGSLDLPFP